MQTQPAVCIARGGTKRQNKKPCFARLRFVSFDSDEGPGEIEIPRAPDRKPAKRLRSGKEETSAEDKKPKRKLGLRFGKEETSSEDKKHRSR